LGLGPVFGLDCKMMLPFTAVYKVVARHLFPLELNMDIQTR
jgi:hypothetical protein